VNIPAIVIAAQDVFRFDLLCVQNLLACLNPDVIADGALTYRAAHRVAAKDVFRGRRRNCVRAACFSFLFSPRTCVFALPLICKAILDVRHLGITLAGTLTGVLSTAAFQLCFGQEFDLFREHRPVIYAFRVLAEHLQ
jgi:hypothetical protein